MDEYTSTVPNGVSLQDLDRVASIYHEIRSRLRQRIIGLDEAIEQILVAVFSGNHALLVGVPGLAKTLMIRSIAELLDLKFSRIQFTPDLMPSDITGTELLVEDRSNQSRHFSFIKGPIFAHLVLADEINRTPPKTQAALLEGMEEGTVTSTGHKFELERPFFVLATQNPIEQEGTYPLPAAQLDRFMFNVLFDYPSQQEEYRIMRLTVSKSPEPFSALLSQQDILYFIRLARKIAISPPLMDYALQLCRRSRPQNENAPQLIRDSLAWGASPRGAQGLILGSKALAMLHGRHYVKASDMRAICHPIFRHRIILNYKAEADGLTPDGIIDDLLRSVPAPDGGEKTQRSRHYSSNLYLSQASR